MAGLQTFGPDGSLIVDAGSNVACVLGIVTIGGSNQAQAGSLTDARLLLGRPFARVVTLEVNSFIGYSPTVRFNGNKVTWSWPPNYGGLAYPVARFIYGLK